MSELIQGALYKFAGIYGPMRDDKPTWAFRPGVYRFVALARDYRTGQDKVVYQAIEGQWDSGQYFICCISDWASWFTRIEESPAKEAGAVTQGSGA